MKKKHYWMFVLMLAVLMGQAMSQKKEIIGYYQSWQWKKSPHLYDPRKIPYDKLTIINYSFFYPLASGEIVGMDPEADRCLLLGEANSSVPDITSKTTITALARSHGTRVILSVGGWDNSSHFPAIAADSVKRANFAHWCVRHINRYHFDGIDIDWEFPGYERHNGTPRDRETFTLLLQAVHDSLRALGHQHGKKYLLTASMPAAASHLPYIETQKIAALLDYLNIMTWDLFGPWGKISNHNSALLGPAQGDSARSLDGAFKLYHLEHNVPAEKINLGAAFYGYAYSRCTGIYGEHQGADTTIFKEKEGILYAQMVEKMALFTRMWDVKAQAPWLVSKPLQVVVSLDDEESVARKADYILQNQAGGLLIWPLMGDKLPDGRTPLLEAAYRKLSAKKGKNYHPTQAVR